MFEICFKAGSFFLPEQHVFVPGGGGGYSTFILVLVCGPKSHKWGPKEQVGTKNSGLKELTFLENRR